MASEKQPHVPQAVIDYLASIYPDRVPHASMTDREIWMAVGRQDVIRKLRQMASSALEQPVDVIVSS